MKQAAARLLRRLPRTFYWVAGAAIACAGALGARFFAESFPLQERVPIWLAGAGVVFFGLCVLSLGTHAWLEPDGADAAEEEPAATRYEGEGGGDAGGEQPPGEQPPGEQAERPPEATEQKAVGAGEGNRTLV